MFYKLPAVRVTIFKGTYHAGNTWNQWEIMQKRKSMVVNGTDGNLKRSNYCQCNLKSRAKILPGNPRVPTR